MRIIPVIDLQAGQVVRGIAGRRAEYRPIESRLVAGADPVTIATALRQQFGTTELYLADLDAIAGRAPAASTYAAIAAQAGQLWVDAGIGQRRRAEHLLREPAIMRLIVGLESLAGWAAFDELLQAIGRERFVFSLDLKQGQVLSTADDWNTATPLQIAKRAIDRGAQRLIVLDLAGVGTGRGVPTLDLCRAIRRASPQVELISGGGVCGVEDLRALADAGCDAALVASALHDGRLTPEELTAL